MKLVLVTVVDEYKKEVFRLFKEAGITSFSESDMEGFKTSLDPKAGGRSS